MDFLHHMDEECLLLPGFTPVFFSEQNLRFAGKFFFANKNRTTGARFQQRFPDKEVSLNASASMKNDTSCARG